MSGTKCTKIKEFIPKTVLILTDTIVSVLAFVLRTARFFSLPGKSKKITNIALEYTRCLEVCGMDSRSMNANVETTVKI